MLIKEAQAKFGEKLDAIEDLNENAHAHYLRVEHAVGNAALEELQAYYARVHGMLPEDVGADRRFPWHPLYKYGDAKKCCENCAELEMAIGVDFVNTGPEHRLAKSLPEFRKLAAEAAAV